MENYSKLKLFTSINWNTIIVISKILTNIALLIILSRFLTPREFGISQFTIIIFNLVAVNVSNSIGLSLIKTSNENNENFYGNLFYFSLILIGLSYFLVGLFFYYSKPDLWFTNLHILLLLAFIFRAFSFYEEYYLMKNHLYKKLAICELLALIVSTTLTIILAILNFSYWSIILGTCIYHLLKSIFLLLGANYIHLKLNFKIRLIDIKSSLSFLFGSLSNNIFNQIDKVLITYFFSLSNFGYYARASQISNLPASTIGQSIDTVLLKVFSENKGKFSDEIKLIEYFIALSNLFILPLAIFIYFHAEKTILLILGPNWLAVSIILKIFAPLSYLSNIVKIYEPIIKSSDNINLRTYIFIIFSIFIFLSFQYFQKYGFEFICYIYFFNYLLFFLVYSIIICQTINFKIIKFIKFFLANISVSILILIFNYFIIDFKFLNIILINLFIYLIIFIFHKYFLNNKFNEKSLQLIRLLL